MGTRVSSRRVLRTIRRQPGVGPPLTTLFPKWTLLYARERESKPHKGIGQNLSLSCQRRHFQCLSGHLTPSIRTRSQYNVPQFQELEVFVGELVATDAACLEETVKVRVRMQ